MSQVIESTEIVRTAKEEVGVNVLTNAVEGGIGYWAGMSDSSRDEDLMYTSITVYDKEDEEEGSYTVTTDDVMKAIKKIKKGGVVNEAMTERIGKLTARNADKIDEALCEIDAYDADAIVQVAAFGEVVFG